MSEYPKWLHHPSYAAAVLSDTEATGANPREHGSPQRFPPVIVHNEDQEQEYIAKGYEPGANRVSSPLPPQKRENPRHRDRENIRMRGLPEPEPAGETYEYPKWVNGKIAKNAEEEAAILAAPPAPAIDIRPAESTDLSDLRAQMSQVMGAVTTLANAVAALQQTPPRVRRPGAGVGLRERAELMRQARERGLNVSRTAKLEELRAALAG